MKPLFLFLFSLSLLSSCTNEPGTHSGSDSATLARPAGHPSDNTDIQGIAGLQTFDAFPDTISGCSESYGYDSVNKDQKHYLFVTDLTMGLLKVNGDTIYLKLQGDRSSKDSVFTSRFEGEGYRVIITTREHQRLDQELFIHKGTMEIWRGRNYQKIMISGEVGC